MFTNIDCSTYNLALCKRFFFKHSDSFFSVEFKLTVNYLEIVIFSDTCPLLDAIISIFADVLLILELFPVENINRFDK